MFSASIFTFHDAAGELVDDLDLALLHHVLDVALVQRLGLERLLQVVHELAVLGGVQVVDVERALDLVHTLLARSDRLALLVDLVVVGDAQGTGDLRERVVGVGRLLGRTRDDQRRPRLVDQDRVDLVDDRVGMAALDAELDVGREVVAQVVEAELRVGAVGDVALVLRAPIVRVLVGLDHADGQPERLVDRAHPLGVAAREVVVHRHQVHALRRQCVQVERQRGGQRLALAGAHLGDRALVQHRPTEQLHVEVAHAERALGRLAHAGERLGQQVVERLALFEPSAELGGLLAELVVGQRLELIFKRIDVAYGGLEAAQGLALARPKQLVQEVCHRRTTVAGAREMTLLAGRP
jgi:hypothetical protein